MTRPRNIQKERRRTNRLFQLFHLQHHYLDCVLNIYYRAFFNTIMVSLINTKQLAERKCFSKMLKYFTDVNKPRSHNIYNRKNRRDILSMHNLAATTVCVGNTYQEILCFSKVQHQAILYSFLVIFKIEPILIFQQFINF